MDCCIIFKSLISLLLKNAIELPTRDGSDENQGACDMDCPTAYAWSTDTKIWRCKDGQCIKEYKTCDGVKDCKDGSDETVETCGSTCGLQTGAWHHGKWGGSFHCWYGDGKCIKESQMCNGVNDCKDSKYGSDEDPEWCYLEFEHGIHPCKYRNCRWSCRHSGCWENKDDEPKLTQYMGKTKWVNPRKPEVKPWVNQRTSQG